MKPNATYKMSKKTKQLLSTVEGKTRNLFKKAMISAELAQAKAKSQKIQKPTDGE